MVLKPYTKEEYDKLIEKHGKHWTGKMIEKLDNYKGASGKKYKSDYRAILSWVVEDMKKSPDYSQYMINKAKKEQQEKEAQQREALQKLRNRNPEIYWSDSGTMKMTRSDLWKMRWFLSPTIWVKMISE